MAIGAIWGEIWNEAIWDTSIWSQDAVEQAKKGGRSRRARYIVEVDGQFIQVATIAEAQSVLAQAKELATVTAQKDVRPKVRIKPPRIAVKTASGKPTTSQTLQRSVQTTQQAVNQIYRKAAAEIEQTRELARLIHRKLEQEDEDEAILALML